MQTAAANDLLLSLEQLTVGYGRQPVLADVNLSLRRGSFTGLLGPNGSGKSTLMKTILGIYPALDGRITLHPLAGRPPVLGYVPQRETLDPIYLLSSLEVVLMGVCGRVKPGRFINKAERDWARDCLAQTGASALGAKLFSQLSGGQKQRVLMARALATRPDLLMLDEPISGIDANASQSIMDLLAALHKGQRQTILMVSHDLNTVRKYAQDVVWLHQGRVLHGPVSDLLSREKIEEILDLEFY
jgi:ABC-type Mn2+/Zn2+ transport system ATPase subunit